MRELYFLWTLWVLKTSAFTMRAFDLITIYIFDAGQGRVAKPNLQQRKKNSLQICEYFSISCLTTDDILSQSGPQFSPQT